jgi:hypothetical protein
MLLVPRQLMRAGMTGNVPYYGGRFTPAQAYAASHPRPPAPAARPPVRQTPPPGGQGDPLSALQQLLDTGVITLSEYEDLRQRVTT